MRLFRDGSKDVKELTSLEDGKSTLLERFNRMNELNKVMYEIADQAKGNFNINNESEQMDCPAGVNESYLYYWWEAQPQSER